MQQNRFLLLKKFKNTESAQLTHFFHSCLVQEKLINSLVPRVQKLKVRQLRMALTDLLA